MKVNKQFLVSGVASLILGTVLIGRSLFENKVKTFTNSSKTHITTKEDNEKIVRNSKIEGYTIFKNSVNTYLQENSQEPTFEEFLEKFWYSDYTIYKESQNENSSTKRSYNSWKNMYEAIKKGETNIISIMELGEQHIHSEK